VSINANSGADGGGLEDALAVVVCVEESWAAMRRLK
jgi:hypothetical protein